MSSTQCSLAVGVLRVIHWETTDGLWGLWEPPELADKCMKSFLGEKLILRMFHDPQIVKSL